MRRWRGTALAGHVRKRRAVSASRLFVAMAGANAETLPVGQFGSVVKELSAKSAALYCMSSHFKPQAWVLRRRPTPAGIVVARAPDGNLVLPPLLSAQRTLDFLSTRPRPLDRLRHLLGGLSGRLGFVTNLVVLSARNASTILLPAPAGLLRHAALLRV